jgi:hypothetical protein
VRAVCPKALSVAGWSNFDDAGLSMALSHPPSHSVHTTEPGCIINHASHSTWPQVKLRLGVRHGRCMLGDDVLRSSNMNSFVSVTSISPVRVIAIPVTAFCASVEVLQPPLSGPCQVCWICTKRLAPCSAMQGLVDLRLATEPNQVNQECWAGG